MNKYVKYQIIVALFIIISAQVHSDENIMVETFVTKGKTSVVLSDNLRPAKHHVSAYARNKCNDNNLCVIWFFDDLNKAKDGVELLKAGNWFNPIPGLITTYSKNKMVTEVICYDFSGAC